MQCQGCRAKNCGECPNCKDTKKYGGPGKKKKACVTRNCSKVRLHVLFGDLYYYFTYIGAALASVPPQQTKVAESLVISLMSKADTFLSKFGRHKQSIVGDSNCLFRCLSYILYGTQERHMELRSYLTEFTSLNESHFIALCHPKTVADHVQHMKSVFVWGTHVEIIAVSLLLNKPVMYKSTYLTHQSRTAFIGPSTFGSSQATVKR